MADKFDPPWRFDPLKKIVNVGWGKGMFLMCQVSFSGGTGSAIPDANTAWAITAEFISDPPLPKINGDNADFTKLLLKHPTFAERRTTWVRPLKVSPDRLIVYDPDEIDFEDDTFNDFYAFAFERIEQDTPEFFSAYNETIFFHLGATFAAANKGKKVSLKTAKVELRFHRLDSYENVPIFFRFMTGKLPVKPIVPPPVPPIPNDPIPIFTTVVDNFLLRNIPTENIKDSRFDTLPEADDRALIDVATVSVTPSGVITPIVFTTDTP